MYTAPAEMKEQAKFSPLTDRVVSSSLFLREALVGRSGMGRDVHSLMMSIQHFLCRPQHCPPSTPQWGAADAEIKVPSGENTELKRSPFKAWSRSVYTHTCYAYCQGFLSCLFLPFLSIHLHFFQNLSRFFPYVGCG